MERRTTLLVHAGASSSRKDDERHVQQVETYLELEKFRPAKARSLAACNVELAPSSARPVHQSEVAAENAVRAHGQYDKRIVKRQPVENDDHRSEVAQLQDSSEYIDDTQLAYTALKSQLFTATTASTSKHLTSRNSGRSPHERDTGNALSPRRPVERISETSPASQDNSNASMVTSPRRRAGSEPVVESSYMRTPIVAHPAKRLRRLYPAYDRAQLDSGSQPVERVLFPLSAGATHDPTGEKRRTENERGDDGTIASDDTTSELPTSYSLSDLASNSRDGSKQDRPQLVNRSVSDPGPISNSLEKSCDPQSYMLRSPQHAALGNRSPAKDGIWRTIADEASHSRVEISAGQGLNLKVTLPASTQPSSHRDVAQQQIALDPAEAELCSLAPEIHPPKPATSNDGFITHATDELNVLRATFLSKYSPMMVARQISVHERGHWSVDCSSWQAPKKLAFWRRLQIWIANGTAGHDIWCTRIADVRLTSRNRFEEPLLQADSINKFEHVRIYCWGELVEHVYLLLYTASEGGVRKLGLKWIDSKGDIVVRMRGPADLR
ncbi:hypothetical protein CB0940_00146 [Cercospora beticola]|uniref:Uncharacterized protein n=1 Tax=Cercospora beticola TaxID=122368 RepID=A0A2G5I931_CERBT|nr:hypothetical protein CB0940_00146 [Cercospora beticola]PIB01317.1 hypothetical protein CB0940_00146 [Cercospora beticola]WPA95548.1 hypothetical protein RHO25_000149 [Cercospora beticola]